MHNPVRLWFLFTLLISAVPATSVGSPDTTWFGGTQWDGVDQRWEALPDSVWTFDSGVGSAINLNPAVKSVGLHSLMEGWAGIDLSGRLGSAQYSNILRGMTPRGRFRRMSMSDFQPPGCVGNPAGLGGNWSLWAGLTQSEADSFCYISGRGYGDEWYITVAQAFYSPGDTVQFSFDYTIETCDFWDEALVFVSDPDDRLSYQLLWRESGVSSGTANLTLRPGHELPATPDTVLIEFVFQSNHQNSDEDGGCDSDCGAFAVDDIVLSGGISHTADFENGDDNWKTILPPLGAGGDWSNLESVADLPPPQISCTCLGVSCLTPPPFLAFAGTMRTRTTLPFLRGLISLKPE